MTYRYRQLLEQPNTMATALINHDIKTCQKHVNHYMYKLYSSIRNSKFPVVKNNIPVIS